MSKMPKEEKITLRDRLLVTLSQVREITTNLGYIEAKEKEIASENTISAIFEVIELIGEELNTISIEVKRLKCAE